MLIIIVAPVDEWDSQSELAFPDDGKLQNYSNFSMNG